MALTFYLPSPPDEIDNVLHDIWQEGGIKQMICVKRLSQRGNNYIRGLLISDSEVELPPLFESRYLSDDLVEEKCDNLKQEILEQENGVEYF